MDSSPAAAGVGHSVSRGWLSAGATGTVAQTTHKHAHGDIVSARVRHAHEESGLKTHRITTTARRRGVGVCRGLTYTDVLSGDGSGVIGASRSRLAHSLTPAYYHTIYARTAFILSARRTAGRHRCHPCMMNQAIQSGTLRRAAAARPREERQPPTDTRRTHAAARRP